MYVPRRAFQVRGQSERSQRPLFYWYPGQVHRVSVQRFLSHAMSICIVRFHRRADERNNLGSCTLTAGGVWEFELPSVVSTPNIRPSYGAPGCISFDALTNTRSTDRLVVHLVINMHKTPVNIRQRLNLILQVLRDVMGFPKRHLGRKDDVDLDKVIRTRVIHSAGIDRNNFFIERHGLRRQSARILTIGRVSGPCR